MCRSIPATGVARQRCLLETLPKEIALVDL